MGIEQRVPDGLARRGSSYADHLVVSRHSRDEGRQACDTVSRHCVSRDVQPQAITHGPTRHDRHFNKGALPQTVSHYRISGDSQGSRHVVRLGDKPDAPVSTSRSRHEKRPDEHSRRPSPSQLQLVQRGRHSSRREYAQSHPRHSILYHQPAQNISEPDLHTRNAPVLNVLVVGATGSGKSTLINLLQRPSLQRSHSFPRIGHDIVSCTASVTAFPCRVPSPMPGTPDTQVNLIDTPGFDDTYVADAEVAQRIRSFLSSSSSASRYLHGIIFMHKISDVRMTGAGLRNAAFVQRLCGDLPPSAIRSRVAFVTSMWDRVRDRTVAKKREAELLRYPAFWGGLRGEKGDWRQNGPIVDYDGIFRLALDDECRDVDSAEDVVRWFVGRADELRRRPLRV